MTGEVPATAPEDSRFEKVGLKGASRAQCTCITMVGSHLGGFCGCSIAALHALTINEKDGFRDLGAAFPTGPKPYLSPWLRFPSTFKELLIQNLLILLELLIFGLEHCADPLRLALGLVLDLHCWIWL